MQQSISQQLQELERHGSPKHRQIVSLTYLVSAASLFGLSLASGHLGLAIVALLLLLMRHNSLEMEDHFGEARRIIHQEQASECDVEVTDTTDDCGGHHYYARICTEGDTPDRSFEFTPNGWIPEIGRHHAQGYFTGREGYPKLLITPKGLIIPD
ncbi:hypothetical protein [Chitinilyticum aquatile]|uniref:hypothetical protein n=1 Tax=Chitinilyticum aquatile TaxID=362520 RepID=UPI0004176C15|nr:hypothetical protein [Chitinilyticum aquatile]